MANYSVTLPSDLDYIPPLRQFVADIARVEGFSKKFCFRTEIIVDELVTNGVVHGSQDIHSTIKLSANFESDQLSISVQDHGGSKKNIEKLKHSVYTPKPPSENEKRGRGLVIVQMLSNELKIDVAEDGRTQVHVIKHRDSDDNKPPREKILYESDV